jgi:hypothetical protein
MSMFYYIVYIAVCAVAILDIMKGTLSGEKKVIWTLVVIFLPIIGAILYYFLGRK